MEIPETRFIWNGEVSLAYQVEGEGSSARDNPQGQRIRGDLARHGRGGGRHGGPR